MLKNLLIYILIAAGIGVMYISTSKPMMEHISSTREDVTEWWGPHNAQSKGDLVNMAYLDDVQKFHSERDYAFVKPQDSTEKEVNLYCLGDSYTFKIPDSAFANVNRYEYAWIYQRQIIYHLDTSKFNILLLENAERYTRKYYTVTDIIRQVYDSVKGHAATDIIAGQPWPHFWGPVVHRYDPFINKYTGSFFNKYINQNLEHNLFNYNFLNAPRAWKAALNYYLFKRASGDVVISKDGQRLFIAETKHLTKKESAYSNITDEEYELIVRNLNFIYNHYKTEGFHEVYLSLIPNPVTITEPVGYNMLIPRLQNDKRLRISFIDMYTPFKKAGEKIYRPGDTHWNNIGIQMWIEAVNNEMRKYRKDSL